MINTKIKNIRGISLISLVITTIVLIILANVIIYNVGYSIKLGKLENMQNDIENLRNKISSYYTQNGKIPASLEYTNINDIKNAGVISENVDTGEFLVIDLSALENLTLNYGKDFEEVKSLESLTIEDEKNYTDLYIINETSHNIFYVDGIIVDNETYYTDYTSESIDSVSVDLRYVEGVKIPDGFYYVEGTKDTGIIIKNDDNNEYKWIVENNAIETISENITINNDEEEDFIKSVNAYKGYYQNMDGSGSVMYLSLNNWSPKYDIEGTYKDKNGDIAHIPEGFRVSETPGENTINEGLVVKDSNDNEWVWIEVPKTIYTTATSSEDYENIEKDMQTYTSTYRDSNYADVFYSTEQHGFENSEQYDNWKNSMLKSIYEKGGFYIGRYETGTQQERTSSTSELTQAVIKKDAYRYNFVTCKQAQELSITSIEGLSDNNTTSLMFGIQWDLVLKFIETKGGKTENIYDLAGNMCEWTLETETIQNACTARGGSDNSEKRENFGIDIADSHIGFRVALW